MKDDVDLDIVRKTFTSGLLPELIAVLRRCRAGDLVAVVGDEESIGPVVLRIVCTLRNWKPLLVRRRLGEMMGWVAQEHLGWRPRQRALIPDLDAEHYFATKLAA